MKMRNYFLKVYESTGNRYKLLKYKLCRNRIITELRKAKFNYFKKIQTSDPKTFLRLIKVLTRKTSSIPTLCASDSHLVHDDAVKANIHNDQLSKHFNYSFTAADLCTEYHFPDAKFPEEFLCTEELVLNLISSLDVKKGTGADAISARMLKATAPSIVPSVTKIFNLSLTTGRFPAAWKFVPIPKAGDLTNSWKDMCITFCLTICTLTVHSLLTSGVSLKESQQPLHFFRLS